MIALLPKDLRVLAHRRVRRRDGVHELHEQFGQVVHVHLVPLGEAGSDHGRKAVLEGPLGHIVGLDGPRVARAAAGAVDAGRADDGGLHGAGGVGGEDDLVHGAVDGFVGEGGDLGDVG